MASKTIYTCDVCGKELPGNPLFLTVQTNFAQVKTFELCEDDYTTIVTPLGMVIAVPVKSPGVS